MSISLSKSAAVERARHEHPGVDFQTDSTLFANINASKEVWWYDLPLKKVTENRRDFIDLLAFDYRTGELHCFHIPVDFFRTNLSKLVIRGDKETISLELSARASDRFQDVRATGGRVRFAQFEVLE